MIIIKCQINIIAMVCVSNFSRLCRAVSIRFDSSQTFLELSYEPDRNILPVRINPSALSVNFSWLQICFNSLQYVSIDSKHKHSCTICLHLSQSILRCLNLSQFDPVYKNVLVHLNLSQPILICSNV